MFEYQLFLGFPAGELFDQSLSKVESNVFCQFVQKEGDYLCEVTHEEIRYFGKYIGKIVDLPKLELTEVNIYSILKKLVPGFPYKEAPLYLFPIKEKLS